MTILTSRHIQCLHLMYAEVACVLVSSGTQVQLQVILNPHYLPDYLSVSCDYAQTKHFKKMFLSFNFIISKICVVVRLAEHVTRISVISSFNHPLVIPSDDSSKVFGMFKIYCNNLPAAAYCLVLEN